MLCCLGRVLGGFSSSRFCQPRTEQGKQRTGVCASISIDYFKVGHSGA